jgi:hypothetical protein
MLAVIDKMKFYLACASVCLVACRLVKIMCDLVFYFSMYQSNVCLQLPVADCFKANSDVDTSQLWSVAIVYTVFAFNRMTKRQIYSYVCWQMPRTVRGCIPSVEQKKIGGHFRQVPILDSRTYSVLSSLAQTAF